MISSTEQDVSHAVHVTAAFHHLKSDLLGQVLVRVIKPDIRIMAIVHKSWHEASSLDSNPRVWGRLLVAGIEQGVHVRAILNDKVDASGITRAVEALIVTGASVNELHYRTVLYGETPLWAACEKGHAAVVEALLKAGADANKESDYETPLWAACEKGHVAVVETLLKAGADANMESAGETPLWAACEKGHVAVVEALLKAGADANKESEDDTPLCAACGKGHVAVVVALLKAGADANKELGGETSL
jgi:ankyrin repeat protein